MRALLNGWAIMIRLTRGLITNTLTNYGDKVHNVCNCVAWLSQVFTSDNALLYIYIYIYIYFIKHYHLFFLRK